MVLPSSATLLLLLLFFTVHVLYYDSPLEKINSVMMPERERPIGALLSGRKGLCFISFIYHEKKIIELSRNKVDEE